MKKQEKFKSKKITSRKENYSRWYSDIIKIAELAEHGPAKGSMIIKPYGYAIWELIQQNLDKKIKKTGVLNAYFPLLIPESLLKKEKDHIEGFSPEIAAVTYAGGKKLKEALIIRPTSETIIYDAFSRWIDSCKDLPILINQWVNVVRWELRPRLFLRSSEFLWQEGHTVHATKEEADKRARMMLELYKEFAKNYMAIPAITGVKTELEKFAGADITYTVETMMQDGKALQFATSHNLGKNFSRAFDIEFKDENNQARHCIQTSWGLSTRTIGALIMCHSDDTGLILPPKLAPYQVVIVPVWTNENNKDNIKKEAKKIYKLINPKFRSIIDLEDSRPGHKFYKWEKKGVPIRIEIGPKDIEQRSVMLARRDNGNKKSIKIFNLTNHISKTLEEIHNNLYKLALERLNEKTVEVSNWKEFVKNIKNQAFVFAYWNGKTEVENKIKEKTGATIRCIPFNQKKEKGKCIYSGEDSSLRVLFAKAY